MRTRRRAPDGGPPSCVCATPSPIAASTVVATCSSYTASVWRCEGTARTAARHHQRLGHRQDEPRAPRRQPLRNRVRLHLYRVTSVGRPSGRVTDGFSVQCSEVSSQRARGCARCRSLDAARHSCARRSGDVGTASRRRTCRAVLLHVGVMDSFQDSASRRAIGGPPRSRRATKHARHHAPPIPIPIPMPLPTHA